MKRRRDWKPEKGIELISIGKPALSRQQLEEFEEEGWRMEVVGFVRVEEVLKDGKL